jgi:copper homeostasis protein (lipoprotein)
MCRRRRYAIGPALACALLVACCGPVRAASALGTLPATFSGVLPCADCMGIHVQLNLLPEGAYVERTTYRRDGHDDSWYELGAWSLLSDGRTLLLTGGREGSAYWEVTATGALHKLDREGNRIDSNLPYELSRRARLESIEPRTKMQGMFRYLADAARFRECRSGLQWPVAMSEDYLALEKAYSAQRTAPGAELLVSLDGRVEQRPRREGGGTEPTLVVERFLRTSPGGQCEPREPQSGLENTRWRPTRIADRAVVVSAHEREPWFVLEPRTKRVTGSGGCNRLSGSYDTGEGTLRFGTLVSTQMNCPSMDTEAAFLAALGATRRYREFGRILELLDDRGRLLVRLEERNLE